MRLKDPSSSISKEEKWLIDQLSLDEESVKIVRDYVGSYQAITLYEKIHPRVTLKESKECVDNL
jgi:hypothetical protein